MIPKIGIEPGLLSRAGPSLAERHCHAWAPVEQLLAHLERLPAGMLVFLAGRRRGYLLVADRTGYEPTLSEAQGHPRENVARVSLEDVASPIAPLRVVAELVNHLLGSNAEPDGFWLSDGEGITPRVAEVGRRIVRLYDLGYGADAGARASRRDYLSRSLAWYIVDRRRLNVADPQIERLLKRSLMSESWWKQDFPQE